MQALRLIVEWDGVVVEDRLFRRRPLVLVGAGPAATVAAPASPSDDDATSDRRRDRYAAFVRRGDGWELRLPAGVARTLAIPGQPDVDGAAGQRRLLTLAGVEAARCGSLVFDGAVVSFELVPLQRDRRDAALWGWTMTALLLAIMSGASYQLVRAYREHLPLHEEGARLSAAAAGQLRVRWTATGAGASRPQAGRGRELHAAANDRPSLPSAQPPPTEHALVGHAHARQKPMTRTQRIATAQAALLNADLRTAVDQLSRASREAPLEYEQLNWLGLAHYMQGHYDEAERAWQDARAREPARADAVNNLANIAKRRDDRAAERALINDALALDEGDCHALNGLALLEAKEGHADAAAATLARSDAACGGHYAYTSIQRAALAALAGDREAAFAALETGLAQVDTLVPIKEFEVWMDLTRDPAFASLRGDARFTQLTTRYLPRATRGG